jgi:Rps23 Pro-64 3,4-dihydroxylase Tpa1-like proline 4-hydroxylase
MNFVKTFTNSLGSTMCNNIISIFENSNNKSAGVTIAGIDLNTKKTTDLHSINLQDNNEWIIIENIVRKELNIKLERYFYEINEPTFICNPPYIIIDKGFQIQKYNSNEGFYIFHDDFTVEENKFRFLTYLWYLNDVTEGGETEFYDGTKIIPETGKLLLFPSTWTHVHRGNMPVSNDKYIMTGWIYSSK